VYLGRLLCDEEELEGAPIACGAVREATVIGTRLGFGADEGVLIGVVDDFSEVVPVEDELGSAVEDFEEDDVLGGSVVDSLVDVISEVELDDGVVVVVDSVVDSGVGSVGGSGVGSGVESFGVSGASGVISGVGVVGDGDGVVAVQCPEDQTDKLGELSKTYQQPTHLKHHKTTY
jgi:hypothetical protein